MACPFQKHAPRAEGSYQYPSLYHNFKEEQKQAHFQGVKDGQALVEKYVPADAVEHPQGNDCWEILYSYWHPAKLKLMPGFLPENYSMLHNTYTEEKTVLVMLNLMPKVMKKNKWNNDDGHEGEKE